MLAPANTKLRMEKQLIGSLNKLTKKDGLVIALAIVVFAVISRVLPHPPNFAPIAAIAIFSGAILPRRLALTLPLLAMIISDYFIGFHSLIFVTWGSFVLMALIASYGMKKINISSVIGYSLLGSVLFFVLTNFAVWAEGSLYPRTVDGLINCYVLAVPFFRNTLISDLFYSGILFGSYYAAVSLAPKLKKLIV